MEEVGSMELCTHVTLYTVDTSIINRKLFEQLYISGRGGGGV